MAEAVLYIPPGTALWAEQYLEVLQKNKVSLHLGQAGSW